ncbi:hypothetical protein NSK_002711 [Nannochloropsis salina CCMP1776]|uniref:Uncharacterized protein n=1 Tax=Nannochloropsis salina CCMP1776 TaxID=1027361 RepID=A0A4D9D2C5_9STRA|nr:hypothetical protein NSK_002711 [Nannochloropsis salina CCMP1776]|eukprot:TFJ85891.1 hypothetical protein NSK_002711 [Nannochloropsis salina CCMP1776]
MSSLCDFYHRRRRRRVTWPLLAAAAAASSSKVVLAAAATTTSPPLSSLPSAARRGSRRVPDAPIKPSRTQEERGSHAPQALGRRASRQESKPLGGTDGTTRRANDNNIDSTEEKRVQSPQVSLLDEYLPLLLEDIQVVDQELDLELQQMFEDLYALPGLPSPLRLSSREAKLQPRGTASAFSDGKARRGGRGKGPETGVRRGGRGLGVGPSSLGNEEERQALPPLVPDGDMLEGKGQHLEVGEGERRLEGARRRGVAISAQAVGREEEEEEEAAADGGRRRRPRGKKPTGKKALRDGGAGAGQGHGGGVRKPKSSTTRPTFPSRAATGKALSSKPRAKPGLSLGPSLGASSQGLKVKNARTRQRRQLLRLDRPQHRLAGSRVPSPPTAWAMAGASLSGLGWACLAVRQIQGAGLASHYTYLLNPTQAVFSLVLGPTLLFIQAGKDLLSPSPSQRPPLVLQVLLPLSLLFAATGTIFLARTGPPAVIAVILAAACLIQNVPHTQPPVVRPVRPDGARSDLDAGKWRRSLLSLMASGALAALVGVGLPLSMAEPGRLLRLSSPVSSLGPVWSVQLGALTAAVWLSQMAVTTFRDAQARQEVWGEEEEEEEEVGGQERLTRTGRQVRALGACSAMALVVSGVGPGAVLGSLLHLLLLSHLTSGEGGRSMAGKALAEVQGGIWAVVASVLGDVIALPAFTEVGEAGWEEKGRGAGQERGLTDEERDGLSTLAAALREQQQKKQEGYLRSPDAESDEQASALFGPSVIDG